MEGGQSTPCNLAVGRGHSPGGVINNRPGVLRRALLLFDTPYNSLICTTVLSARLCTEITEAEKKKIINGPPCVPPPLESVEEEGEVVPRSRVPIDNVNYVIYEAGISLANANDRE